MTNNVGENHTMDITNNKASWLGGNDWVMPIIASIILVLAPMVVSTLGIVLPGWLTGLASIGACAGLLFGTIKARLTNTLSAKAFSQLALIAGWMIAIWQIIHLFKH